MFWRQCHDLSVSLTREESCDMVQGKDLFEIEKDLQLFHPNSEIWGLGRPREVSRLLLNKQPRPRHGFQHRLVLLLVPTGGSLSVP